MGTLASPPMGVDVSGWQDEFPKKKNARHAEKRSLPEEDQRFLGVHLSSVFFFTPWVGCLI